MNRTHSDPRPASAHSRGLRGLLSEYLLALVLAVLLAAGLSTNASARSITDDLSALLENVSRQGTTTVPAAGEIEIGFSPRAGAEDLVIKVIASARRELRVMAYSFTSAPVTAALLAAKKRGVDVRLVADHKHNAEERSGRARAALGALSNAGIQVRTTNAFQIAHDKVIVADGLTTQTGSFNYSAAAAKSNSENVIVLWNNPKVARSYLAHWENSWRTASEWRSAY